MDQCFHLLPRLWLQFKRHHHHTDFSQVRTERNFADALKPNRLIKALRRCIGFEHVQPKPAFPALGGFITNDLQQSFSVTHPGGGFQEVDFLQLCTHVTG